MICTKCDKDLTECSCPDALERLKWLVSGQAPIVFSPGRLAQYVRRIRELEGYKELEEI